MLEEKRQIKTYELSKKGILAFNDWIKLDQILLEIELKQADFESLINSKNSELLINDSSFLNVNWNEFDLISLDKIKATIAIYSSQFMSLEIDLASEKLRLDQLELTYLPKVGSIFKFWRGGMLGNQMDYREGITIPVNKPKLRREE